MALVIQVLMAAAGAYARVLNMKEPTELKAILGQVFIAGFTGLCLYWVSGVLNVDQGLMFALAGIAGWVGPRALDGLGAKLTKQTGINFTDKKDDN
jgi:drug/metabolite transporter (DMT)-like permease